jgi:hypothetical protein
MRALARPWLIVCVMVTAGGLFTSAAVHAADSGGGQDRRPVEYVTVRNGTTGCTSGQFSPMPNFYADSPVKNVIPLGQPHQLTRWSCVVWPYHRAGMLEVVDFQPSPRPNDANAVHVNGVPFLSASPGITLWRVIDAHVGRTSEGTLVFTDSHVFPGARSIAAAAPLSLITLPRVPAQSFAAWKLWHTAVSHGCVWRWSSPAV